MHHGHHLRAGAVDLAVDVALADRVALARRVERLAVEAVLQQVAGLHRLRGDIAREDEALRVARRAHADVPVGVDHAVLGEDAVRRDEVFEKGLVHR